MSEHKLIAESRTFEQQMIDRDKRATKAGFVVGGVGLLTEDRTGLIQAQNGEKAAVIFPQLFRAIPLSGAEVQTVPRCGGHAALPGGKAVGNLIQNIGGEPHQTGLLMLLKGHS